MARSARQLVFAKHGLLFPGILLLARIGARDVPMPIPALHRLPAIAPRRDAARIDDLTLDMEAADQKVVAGVLQILEHGARVLSHQDGMRGVIVNAELIPDPVPLADSMQRNPWPRGIGNVVMPGVGDIPARHGTLLDPKRQPAGFGLCEQGHEHLFEHHQIGVHSQERISAYEARNGIRPEQHRGVEDAPHQLVLLGAH